MKTPAEIKKGYISHFDAENKDGCKACPYWNDGCVKAMKADVRALLEELVKEEGRGKE